MSNLSDLTRKDQVLKVLRDNLGAWIDGTALANEEVGGSEGLKRLRELKNEGHLIQMRKHPTPGRDIYQYRLVEQTAIVQSGVTSAVEAEKCEHCKERSNVYRCVCGIPCDWAGCPALRRSTPPPPKPTVAQQRATAEGREYVPPAPRAPEERSLWSAHNEPDPGATTVWRDWQPAKKVPGTLEHIFWIGKQRVIGAIGQIAEEKWGWGVLIPGSPKKNTKDRRAGHGVAPDKTAARDAVEECVRKLRETGV